MRVTIISDASHCPSKKVGGWAFWAISERGSHAGDGTFKSVHRDALICEMAAIVNALHCSLKLGIAIARDHVLIQTDCQGAIDLFGGPPSQYIGPKTRKRPDVLSAIDAFTGMRLLHQLDIEFRHVKAHTATMDKRSIAQRNADRRARNQMRAGRAKVG